MQCTKEVISLLPFWASLSEQQKQQFESGLLYKRCRAGESLTFSGEKKDGMLIVLHGVIRVYMVSSSCAPAMCSTSSPPTAPVPEI